jgi:hypothetical protein
MEPQASHSEAGTIASDLLMRLAQADRLVHEAIPQVDEAQSKRRLARLVRRLYKPVNDRLVDKALGSMHDRLAEAQRLLQQVEAPRNDQLARLDASLCRIQELLDREGSEAETTKSPSPTEPPEAAVWLIDHDLQCALVELGHREHLLACLDDELHRDPSLDEPRHQLSRKEIIEFGKLRDQLSRNGDEESIADGRARAIELLVERYQQRAQDGRHGVSREAVRRQLLTLAAIGLTVLVLVFAAFVIVAVGVRWWDVALVSSSAMLGSLLSGLRRLRDELQRIRDITAFRSAFLAQLAAGAGLGILALLLFRGGLLPVFRAQGTETDADIPATLAIYAFAAGFSEPFAIGAIQRIVGARS